MSMLKALLILSGSCLICYLLWAFMYASFDASTWTQDARVVATIVAALVGLVVIVSSASLDHENIR